MEHYTPTRPTRIIVVCYTMMTHLHPVGATDRPTATPSTAPTVGTAAPTTSPTPGAPTTTPTTSVPCTGPSASPSQTPTTETDAPSSTPTVETSGPSSTPTSTSELYSAHLARTHTHAAQHTAQSIHTDRHLDVRDRRHVGLLFHVVCEGQGQMQGLGRHFY